MKKTLTKYLVITANRKWGGLDAKLISKLGTSAIPANAVVIKLNMELPAALFTKPQLEATIKVDERSVSKPVIDAEVLENITALMNKNLGIDMKISVVENS